MSEQSVPLSNPDITQQEIDAVLDVLRGDRLSIGPRIEAFESACAARAGRKYGIGVNSGTSGLHLCVKALGLAEGDEVITTPFSFIATTNCVLFERATPVFAEIDPVSYNLDPAAIEAAITPRTRALLPVEVFGNPAHFDVYEKIARKHKLLLIEDCCEALGASLDGRPAGNFGECGVFAFYPNKQITTGEGGLIVTDSESVRDLCRSMRNQGRATDAWLSHARLGYNYRLSEINAALGEVQVRRLDDILAKRRAAADLYDQALGDLVDQGLLHLPPMADRNNASWFVYVIRLADEFTEADRDAVLEHLRKEGVGCNNYFAPIHTQPYIKEMLGTKEGDFPITERIAARTIALPFFANLSEGQVSRVKDVLAAAIVSRR
ncbi:MAG TPA: polysaccharide biosynthesis protein [Phycisphaerales bacterium]|nr:polysaccharide biosynthesis protein [Phycisphaerales bacterium]